MEATLAKPSYFTRFLAQATGNVRPKVGHLGRRVGQHSLVLAPTWRSCSLKLGSWAASWATLAAFWLPFARHFVSRVLPSRPRCRQDTVFRSRGPCSTTCFPEKTYVFNVTDCLWLPNRAYVLMCFLSAYLSQRASRSLTKTGLC